MILSLYNFLGKWLGWLKTISVAFISPMAPAITQKIRQYKMTLIPFNQDLQEENEPKIICQLLNYSYIFHVIYITLYQQQTSGSGRV